MGRQRRPPRRADAHRRLTRAQNLEQEQLHTVANAVSEDVTQNEPPLTPARGPAPASDTPVEYPAKELETPASDTHTENPGVDSQSHANQLQHAFSPGASAPKRKRTAEAVQQTHKCARRTKSTKSENKKPQNDAEEQHVTHESAQQQVTRVSTESADSTQQRVTRTSPQQQVVRRSPRIRIKQAEQNPATTFETCFTRLPKELELLVWDKAAESQMTSPGRIVLLRNTKEALPPMTPNALPACFTVSVDAYRAMSKQYKRLFVRHDSTPSTASEPSDEPLAATGHWFNPEKDVLYLTPCCSGCRAYHCAKKNFTEADRAVVRYMAVTMENPNLGPTAWPCWKTIPLAWPNVQSLILLTNAPLDPLQFQPAEVNLQPNGPLPQASSYSWRFEQVRALPQTGITHLQHWENVRLRYLLWQQTEGKDAVLQDVRVARAVRHSGIVTDPLVRDGRIVID